VPAVGFGAADICAPFPDAVNPHAPWVAGIAAAWIETAGLTPTDGARERMRRTDPYGAAAHTWAHAGFRDLDLETRWLATVFRLDDQLDEGAVGSQPQACAEVIGALCDVLDGHIPAASNPVLAAFTGLWHETRPLLPGPWAATFAAHVKKWLWTYHEDAVLAASGLPPDLASHLRRREYSVGMPWLYDLATLDLHPLLPSAPPASPAMRALRRAASLHSGLVNDLFSADRESRTGYPSNAVLIVERTTGRTRREAASVVNTMITTLAREVLAARAALPAELDATHTPPEARAAVLLHTERIATCTRGQVTWHASSPRYAIDDLTTDGRPIHEYPEDLLPTKR